MRSPSARVIRCRLMVVVCVFPKRIRISLFLVSISVSYCAMVNRGRSRARRGSGVRRGNQQGRRGRQSSARPIDSGTVAIVIPPADPVLEQRTRPVVALEEEFQRGPRKRPRNVENWKSRQRSHVPRAYTPCTQRCKCGEKFANEDFAKQE